MSHRHQWVNTGMLHNIRSTDPLVGDPLVMCNSCGKAKDEAASKRGKSSARFGKDQERRAERKFGWEKIGERGEGTDLRGRFAEVQQRSTRRLPPSMWTTAFAKLDATKEDRVPLLLLSYVRQGVPAEDFIVIRGADWLELHGTDEALA